MRHMEALDTNSQYKRHATIAIRTTIGTIPMDEFFADKELCPAKPMEKMPDVDPKFFDEVSNSLAEDKLQDAIVSCLRPILEYLN